MPRPIVEMPVRVVLCGLVLIDHDLHDPPIRTVIHIKLPTEYGKEPVSPDGAFGGW